VGFNATFFPMHFLGLNGMPRRTWTYDSNMGWNGANFVSTMGAYLLGVGVLIYVVTLLWSYFKGRAAGPDPWDARTLEWSIPSPPPVYNFAAIPMVHARDAWWYEKHHPEETAREQTAHVREEAAHGGSTCLTSPGIRSHRLAHCWSPDFSSPSAIIPLQSVPSW